MCLCVFACVGQRVKGRKADISISSKKYLFKFFPAFFINHDVQLDVTDFIHLLDLQSMISTNVSVTFDMLKPSGIEQKLNCLWHQAMTSIDKHKILEFFKVQDVRLNTVKETGIAENQYF